MFGASERCLDRQLWHACAGAMVQMPPLNSKVFYFPQGHAEHAHEKLDFGNTRIPSLIPCRVSAIRYMAEQDTDEVFVKMRLTPLRENELDLEDDGSFMGVQENHEEEDKNASFAKTLTQSDANNGGGFSVPRYCAETIFPKLDYSANPPLQTIVAKDVHGQCWKFRHIYRGTPRRHLLTTGWSSFVSQKKLVAGDSIVFLRARNGDLCVGIRRAKKVDFSPLPLPGNLLCEKKNNNESILVRGKGCLAAESVSDAVICAVKGLPFEIVYYPRGSTPEYCVKASLVRDAMRVKWCTGMRFKMPFETEDSSRISWFMGTISSVQVSDPTRWPGSPWRLLQVVWDEPDLLQNVKCVNPWLVELVSNMPAYHHLSPFSLPRKKPRFLENPDFTLTNQLPLTAFSSNLLLSHGNSLCNNNIHDNSCAGIQGARHAQFGLSPSDYFAFNKLPSESHIPLSLRPNCGATKNSNNNVDIHFLSSVGNSGLDLKEKANEAKSPPRILLFGQVISTEQQSSNSCCASTNRHSISSEEGTLQKISNDSLQENSPKDNSSDGGSPWYKDQQKSGLGPENANLLCLAL